MGLSGINPFSVSHFLLVENRLHSASMTFPCVPKGRSSSVHFSSVAQSCPTLRDLMDCSMPGLFVVIHTVKGFGIVNKAEVDVFLELSHFFDDRVDVGNLISGPSAKFTVHILLKPGLEILGIILLVCE